MNKVWYLEGLRGLAAFVVVVCHFIGGFYPQIIFPMKDVAIKPYQEIIALTPLNLVVAGNFAVCIFFVLSGYVLSYKFFQGKNYELIVSSALKRYSRLAIPILFSVSISYLLLKFNLYLNKDVADITNSAWLSGFWDFDPSLYSLFKQSLYSVFFQNDFSYNAVLWTMQYEFYGSFLIFSFLALFGSVKKRYIVYAILIFLFWETYYLAFILGMVLSDLSTTTFFEKVSRRKVLLFILFIIAIFLGSYTKISQTQDTIWSFLNVHFLGDLHQQFYHIIGAFLLIFCMLCSKMMQNFFSTKVMLFLGRISFSIYLLHLLLLGSFSCFMFNTLLHWLPYGISFLITFISSMFMLFPLSYLMYKYVDVKAIQLSSKAYRWFVK